MEPKRKKWAKVAQNAPGVRVFVAFLRDALVARLAVRDIVLAAVRARGAAGRGAGVVAFEKHAGVAMVLLHDGIAAPVMEAVLAALGRLVATGLVPRAPHAWRRVSRVLAGQADHAGAGVAGFVHGALDMVMVVSCGRHKQLGQDTQRRARRLHAREAAKVGVVGGARERGAEGGAPWWRLNVAWPSSTASTITAMTIERHTPA